MHVFLGKKSIRLGEYSAALSIIQSNSGKICSKAYSSIKLYPVPPQGGETNTALNYLLAFVSGKCR